MLMSPLPALVERGEPLFLMAFKRTSRHAQNDLVWQGRMIDGDNRLASMAEHPPCHVLYRAHSSTRQKNTQAITAHGERLTLARPLH